MIQLGFFDIKRRLDKIDKNGDPLKKLDEVIEWEIFRPELEALRRKERKSPAGRRPFDVVMMFKILILQSLYNLSDEALEMQILDRLSFMRFLGIRLGDPVPDATTIWKFREMLVRAGVVKELFRKFDNYLRTHGYQAMGGQIIDASLVSVPIQRNSREENRQIKEGRVPEGWSKAKRSQKDTDARWTRKHGKNYFGYKNHVEADVGHKIIRDFEVTDASVHDSQVFEGLLDEDNTSRDVWGDSAYWSKERVQGLRERGYREHLHRKGSRYRKLTEREKRGNRTRSKIRSRIEHIFGVQAQRAGSLILRTIGIARARAKIGLRNLAYNMDRYCTLVMA